MYTYNTQYQTFNINITVGLFCVIMSLIIIVQFYDNLKFRKIKSFYYQNLLQISVFLVGYWIFKNGDNFNLRIQNYNTLIISNWVRSSEFKLPNGAFVFAVLRSITDTIIKNNQNVLNSLRVIANLHTDQLQIFFCEKNYLYNDNYTNNFFIINYYPIEQFWTRFYY